MKKALLSLSLACVALCVAVAGRAETALNGGGSSFDQPAFAKWFEAYRKVDPTVTFNYQANGSGFGQSALLSQTIDFGASDFTMDDQKMAKSNNGPVLQLPIVAGAVVLSYNLPGSPKLKFDGETVADIYLGKITKWNDPKIAALNPGVSLPNSDIVAVHRSDSSGTSYIFTDYLSSVSSAWDSSIGRSSTPKWVGGIGGKGNAGVAGQVKQLPGAIGYVELAYAVQNKLPYATMKNRAGKFVEASPESVSVALGTATIPDDFRFSMVNAPGDAAYPIAGPSWVLLYQQQKDAAKGAALAKFFKWVVTEGQKISPELDYAPLPESVQKRILAKLASVKS
ncbi:phosphate ABC transporter substrate-binding protein PstS [Opitutaceae bacterium EW11]|nr:phosphate ABC transporter substrate-binding protein PstS [Opitutaceae bacterium EW11]